jgi:WD40 repeat protein
VQKLSERRRLTLEGSFPIGDLAWTPGGMYLVLAMPTEKGEPLLRWYDTRTLSPAAAPTEIRGSHVAFSPDGKLMATAWSDLRDHLEIRRTADWTVSQRVGGQFYGIHALAFSPDGRLLAMANGSAQVRLLEVKSGLVLYELKVPCQGVHAPLLQDVAFSPDGKLVAGAAYGGTVQVWRTPDGSPVTTVQTGATQPNAVAFLDAGRFVTTGFPLANVWQIDGTLQTKLDGRDKPLDIAVSPDGRVLVTVERFQMLFWDVAGRRMVHRIESDEPLRALRLSPDGAALATIGGRDGRTIRVWGVERGAWGDGTRTTQHAARGDVKRVA